MRDELWQGRQLTVQSGYIWLAEQMPAQTAAAPLFATDCAAIADANVILYDRKLGDRLAEILPIGAYAEPLPAISALVGPAISPRAVQFAAEGWSVVQLVERSPATRTRWRSLAAELLRQPNPADLSIVALAKSSLGPIRRDEGTVQDVPRLIDEAGDDFLTLICGPLSGLRAALPATPSTANLFTASGLAG